jgi:hypothetical protein
LLSRQLSTAHVPNGKSTTPGIIKTRGNDYNAIETLETLNTCKSEKYHGTTILAKLLLGVTICDVFMGNFLSDENLGDTIPET